MNASIHIRASAASRRSTRAASPRAARAGAIALACLLGGCSHRPSSVSALEPPHVSAAEAGDPAITCDPSTHAVLLAWLAGDSTGYRLWFSRSADRGGSWSPPVAVSPPGEPLRLDPESSPRMVCDVDGRVALVWSTSYPVPGRGTTASDVRFARSLDGGRHWSGAVTLDGDSTGAPGRNRCPSISGVLEGGLVTAWLAAPLDDGRRPADDASGDASVQFARSGDFGDHWDTGFGRLLRACPGCRVSVAADPTGVVFVAFRKHFENRVRDAVVSGTAGAIVRARDDGWAPDSCPHAGPPLVVSHDGTLRLAWFTGAPGRVGVYFRQAEPGFFDSVSTPLSVLESERLHAVHADLGVAGIRGTLIACDADSSGGDQLTLARVAASGRRVVERFVVPGTRGAAYPHVGSRRNWRDAYVVWTTREGGRSRLRLARWDLGS